MYKRRPHKVTVIRYSCVTGKAIWLYQGQSHAGMLKAYQRARKHEITLQRKWPRLMERRTKNIQRLLDECLAAKKPENGGLTEAQRAAIKTLQTLANKPPEYYSGFYNHIRAERRRRDKKSRRWHKKGRQESQDKNKDNQDYDK